jgi:hypothetical protein
MKLPTVKKVLPSRGQYLDLKAIHHLLGDIQHGRIGSLPVSLLYFQLEAFLKNSEGNFSPAVGSIPRRLLEHNKQPRKLHLCEMAQIDADVVFSYDVSTKRTDMQWKAYFEHPQFARAESEQRVVLHISVKEGTGLTRTISVPLQALMVGYGDVAEGHQGYAHSITFMDPAGGVLDQVYYIGVTSRNWLIRMEEHLAEIRGGSNKRFHAAWRAYAGDATVMLGSELIALNHTFQGIMAWEEEQVDAMMAAKKSLNMIPGGFKGMRLLHQHRLTDGVEISLEERDKAIAEYVRRVGVRAGVPNLFLAELWRDDEFYLKVLAGRSDVLTPGQVLAIRDLAAKGRTAQQIVEVVGARNVEQVQRVLQGKTYKRIQLDSMTKSPSAEGASPTD